MIRKAQVLSAKFSNPEVINRIVYAPKTDSHSLAGVYLDINIAEQYSFRIKASIKKIIA